MIKVEAVQSFATSYLSMGRGTVVTLPNERAEKLIAAGLVKEVDKPAEAPKEAPKKKGVKANDHK